MPPGDRLPAWVFAIARNAVIDHYRARSLRDHADVSEIEPAAGPRANEEHEALRDLTPCLERMIRHLPEPYRKAMRLADFKGVGQQEIADRMGISLSGAKSRVQRARQQLQEMILDCCDIERDARGGVVDVTTTERTARYCGDATPDDGRCGGG